MLMISVKATKIGISSVSFGVLKDQTLFVKLKKLDFGVWSTNFGVLSPKIEG